MSSHDTLPLKMTAFLRTKFCRLLRIFVVCTLLYSTLLPNQSLAQTGISTGASILNLPIPGVMVKPTVGFNPTLLVGVKVYPDNPFRFDFIVDTGEDKLQGEELKAESTKLIKYFLASLTVPEDELWVNLSPYEKDRIIPEKFGITEMGKDLLAQDYLLKQLTASLIYPEEELGKNFWDKIYQKAYDLYGTTNIPINTFNKVWIIPDNAVVYENKDVAFVVESHLKVMLEGDYLALQNNLKKEEIGTDKLEDKDVRQLSDVSSQIVKDVILPAIEKEVNEGKNFAQLRQIYSGLILAAWYKKRLKESILSRVYVDKNKVAGVDVEDKEIKNKIYEQYVEAFKQGVYNYIKEDDDPFVGKAIKRRYVSGGFTTDGLISTDKHLKIIDEAQVAMSAPLKQKIIDGFRKILNPIMIVGAALLLPNTASAQDRPQQPTRNSPPTLKSWSNDHLGIGLNITQRLYPFAFPRISPLFRMQNNSFDATTGTYTNILMTSLGFGGLPQGSGYGDWLSLEYQRKTLSSFSKLGLGVSSDFFLDGTTLDGGGYEYSLSHGKNLYQDYYIKPPDIDMLYEYARSIYSTDDFNLYLGGAANINNFGYNNFFDFEGKMAVGGLMHYRPFGSNQISFDLSYDRVWLGRRNSPRNDKGPYQIYPYGSDFKFSLLGNHNFLGWGIGYEDSFAPAYMRSRIYRANFLLSNLVPYASLIKLEGSYKKERPQNNLTLSPTGSRTEINLLIPYQRSLKLPFLKNPIITSLGITGFKEDRSWGGLGRSDNKGIFGLISFDFTPRNADYRIREPSSSEILKYSLELGLPSGFKDLPENELRMFPKDILHFDYAYNYLFPVPTRFREALNYIQWDYDAYGQNNYNRLKENVFQNLSGVTTYADWLSAIKTSYKTDEEKLAVLGVVLDERKAGNMVFPFLSGKLFGNNFGSEQRLQITRILKDLGYSVGIADIELRAKTFDEKYKEKAGDELFNYLMTEQGIVLIHRNNVIFTNTYNPLEAFQIMNFLTNQRIFQTDIYDPNTGRYQFSLYSEAAKEYMRYATISKGQSAGELVQSAMQTLHDYRDSQREIQTVQGKEKLLDVISKTPSLYDAANRLGISVSYLVFWMKYYHLDDLFSRILFGEERVQTYATPAYFFEELVSQISDQESLKYLFSIITQHPLDKQSYPYLKTLAQKSTDPVLINQIFSYFNKGFSDIENTITRNNEQVTQEDFDRMKAIATALVDVSFTNSTLLDQTMKIIQEHILMPEFYALIQREIDVYLNKLNQQSQSLTPEQIATAKKFSDNFRQTFQQSLDANNIDRIFRLIGDKSLRGYVEPFLDKNHALIIKSLDQNIKVEIKRPHQMNMLLYAISKIDVTPDQELEYFQTAHNMTDKESNGFLRFKYIYSLNLLLNTLPKEKLIPLQTKTPDIVQNIQQLVGLPTMPDYERIKKTREFNIKLYNPFQPDITIPKFEANGYTKTTGGDLVILKKEINGIKVTVSVDPRGDPSNYKGEIFSYIGDLRTDMIVYSGHTGMGASLAFALDNAPQVNSLQVGNKTICILSCGSAPTYMSRIKQRYPYVHFWGALTPTVTSIDTEALLTIIEGFTERLPWEKIYERVETNYNTFIDESRRQNTVHYLSPHQKESLKYMDLDGDGHPDSERRDDNIYVSYLTNIYFSDNDNFNFEFGQMDITQVRSNKVQNVISRIAYFFEFNDYLRDVKDYLKPGTFRISYEDRENAVSILDSYSQGGKVYTIDLNMGYRNSSEAVLSMMGLFESNRHFTKLKKEKVGILDDLRGLQMVAEFTKYYHKENLFPLFLQKYGIRQIPLEKLLNTLDTHPTNERIEALKEVLRLLEYKSEVNEELLKAEGLLSYGEMPGEKIINFAGNLQSPNPLGIFKQASRNVLSDSQTALDEFATANGIRSLTDEEANENINQLNQESKDAGWGLKSSTISQWDKQFAKRFFDVDLSSNNSDQASIVGQDNNQSNKGGIDLNPTNLDLQIKGEGMNFNLFYDCPEGTVQFNTDKCTPRNSEQLQNIPINGFYPVIFSVAPVPNLLPLLGFDTNQLTIEQERASL